MTGTLIGDIEMVREAYVALLPTDPKYVRALAVTTATRLPVLPEVPTVGEFVAGYEASGFTGLGAPRSTPAEIIDKLNTEVNAALGEPKYKEVIAAQGGTPTPMTPADFGKFLVNETEKWAKVLKFANIKPE